ncbi:MAG: hypothetical protein RL654_3033 [Pseudomonadota bacterium]|jgi:hypothetical protein
MKILLIFLALSIPVTALATNIIPEGARFRPDSLISENTESGEINGIKYKIDRENGDAVFQGIEGASLDGSSVWDGTNWTAACKRDAMSDGITCHLKRGALWVFQFKTGRTTVSIGSDHYPGSSVAVRIDNLPPIQAPAGKDGNLDTSASGSVTTQLSKGQKFRTRYMKWPYREWVEGEEGTRGFTPAHEYLKWVMRLANTGPTNSKPKTNIRH